MSRQMADASVDARAVEVAETRLPSSAQRLAAFVRQTFIGQLRPALIWGGVIGLLGAMYTALYPSMSADFDLDSFIEQMPESMKAFMPSLEGGMDTIEGFLDLELFGLLVPLALPFFLIIMGARAIAGREEQRRMDLLFSNPIPRWMLVVGTAITMLLAVVVSLLVGGIITYLPAPLAGVDLPLVTLLASLLYMIPFALFFGSLALLVSSMVRRTALAIGLPGGLLVVMYVVNGLAGLSDNLEPVQPLSLFSYYEAPMREGVDPLALLIISALSVVLVAVSIFTFNRREIYT